MGKGIKRAIALLLLVLMFVSLFPASFAETEAVEEEVFAETQELGTAAVLDEVPAGEPAEFAESDTQEEVNAELQEPEPVEAPVEDLTDPAEGPAALTEEPAEPGADLPSDVGEAAAADGEATDVPANENAEESTDEALSPETQPVEEAERPAAEAESQPEEVDRSGENSAEEAEPALEERDDEEEIPPAESEETGEENTEDTAELQPVRVVFVCDPEDTRIIVYDLSRLDENDEPLVVDPEEDDAHCYLLLPGEYLYDAECEGYEKLEKVVLEVTEQTAAQTYEASEEEVRVEVFLGITAENEAEPAVSEEDTADETPADPMESVLVEETGAEIEGIEAVNALASGTSVKIENTKSITGDAIVSEARSWKNKGIANASYYSVGSTSANVARRTGYNSYIGESGLSFDCSGFVCRVLNDVGLRVTGSGNNEGRFNEVLFDKYGENHISSDAQGYICYYGEDVSSALQKAKNGDYSELKPGDLLGWKDGSTQFPDSPNHITIYAGEKKIVHFTGSGFRDETISSAYLASFQYARRLVPAYNIRAEYPCDLTVETDRNNLEVWTMPGNTETYPDSKVIGKLSSAGMTLHVTKIIENNASVSGHFWYQTVYSGTGQTGYVYVPYTNNPKQNWTVSASNVSMPTNLSVGETFTVKGTVSSGGSKITQLQGFIYAGETTTGTAEQSSNPVSPNSTNASLSSIDSSLYFNKISDSGRYTYTVKVDLQSYTIADGKPKAETKSGIVVNDVTTYYTVGGQSGGETQSANLDQTGTEPILRAYSSGVALGEIRYVSQNSNLSSNGWGAYANKAGGECGYASQSMALSYLGKDVSPEYLCDGEYSKGKWNTNYAITYDVPGISVVSGSGAKSGSDAVNAIDTMLSAHINDCNAGNVSPVVIHYIKGTTMHAIIIVNKDSSGNYIAVDPAKGMSTFSFNISSNGVISGNVTYGSSGCSIDRIEQYRLTNPAITLTFNPSGGTCSTSSKSYAKNQNAYNLPRPTLSGYAFDWWYTEPFGGSDFTEGTVVTENKTLYAHWSDAGTKVTFHAQGGDLASDTISHQLNGVDIDRGLGYLVVYKNTTPNTNQYGTELTVDSQGRIVGFRSYNSTTQLTTPQGGFRLSGHANGENTGSSFVGSIHNGEYQYVGVDYATGTVTAYKDYASYLAGTKHITGDIYGELPVPTKSGAVFGGWYTSSALSERVYYYSASTAGSLYAKWDSPSNLTVAAEQSYDGHVYQRFDYNVSWTEAETLCESMGGHLVTITSQDEQDAVVALMNNSPLGMYHIGATDAELEGTWKWVTGETFSYNNWDKTGGNEPNGGTAENYSIIVSKDYAPNKVVGEWVDCDSVYYGEFYSISNTGFICEFDRPQEYTVSYDPNGGTGAPESQTKTAGEDLTLTEETPTREGYIFLGWATSADAEAAEYQSGDSFTQDANTVLYAVWDYAELFSGVWGELNWVIDSGGTLTISGSGPMKDGAYMFSQNWNDHRNSFNRVVIEEGVTSVGAFAFYKCTNITQVSLPDSITRIGGAAFATCTKLTEIDIPEHVASIGDSAFAGSGLTQITIPASVGSIGDSAFSVSTLTSVTFEGGAPEIGEDCFDNVEATVFFPANDANWTERVRQNYGGTLTWVACTADGYSYGAPSWTWTSGYGGASAIFTCLETGKTQTLSASVTSTRIEPDCTVDGSIVNTASVTFLEQNYTDAKQTGTLPAAGHTAGIAVRENETAPTCTAEGAYDEVVYCTVCGEEMSRVTHAVERLPHTTELRNVIKATAGGNGYTGDMVCTVCGEVVTQGSVTYYITYNANGGTGAPAAQTKTHGTELTLASAKPTREGYTFLGWATDSAATAATYQPGANYTADAGATLYAVWQAVSPTPTPTPTPPPATGARFAVSDVSAAPGADISLTVSVEENPGLASFEFEVDYDASVLEWTGLTKESIGGMWDAAVGESLLWVDSENYTGNGTLFTLNFKIKDSAEAGTTEVTLRYDPDNVFDAEGRNVSFAVVPGVVTIRTHIPGDINGDGSVNNKDLLWLMKHLKGKDVVVVEEALDVNGDGKQNNKDLLWLMKYLKGKDVVIY